MADSVAIIPELSFVEQIQELAAFFARTIPSGAEWSTSLVQKAQAVQGEEQQAAQTEVVNELVKGIEQSTGGFEASDREIEPAYLLLATVLSSTFSSSPADFQKAFQTVLDTVVKATKNALTSKGKGEVGYRVLTNTYNLLPASSPLRPVTLQALLSLLVSTSNSSFLPLTTAQFEQSVLEWDIPTAERISWLNSTAAIYESTETESEKEKARELRVLALTIAARENVAIKSEEIDKTLATALALPTKFALDDILTIKGVKESLSADAKSLIGFLDGSEQGQDLESGLKWVESKKSWLESLGLTTTLVARKLRLLALTSLCANSASREVKYADIAKGLNADASEVEEWVIDAIHSDLLVARLSQPTQTLRIQSVHSRSFGPSDWKLLESRLGEWKSTLDEVRQVVQEALVIGTTENAGQGKEKKGRRQGQQQQQQQQQQQGQEQEKETAQVAA